MTLRPSNTLKPRKSPRQKRSGQMVEILLEAAAQVLERSGLEGFTTNTVAQRAGVGVGSLYQYFPNKDALLLALMRREQDLFDVAAGRCCDSATGFEGLNVIVHAAAEQQLLRPNLARLLDVQQALPEMRAEVGGADLLLGLIRAQLTRPDLPRQFCVDVAARDVLAILRGLTDTAGEFGECSIEDLERRVAAAVFGYLQAMAVRTD